MLRKASKKTLSFRQKVKGQSIKPANPIRQLHPETPDWGTGDHKSPPEFPLPQLDWTVNPHLWYSWWDDTIPTVFFQVCAVDSLFKQLNKVCTCWTFYHGNCQHWPHTVCLFFPSCSFNTLKSPAPGNIFPSEIHTHTHWALVTCYKNIFSEFTETHCGPVLSIKPTSRLKDICKRTAGNKKTTTTVATKESKPSAKTKT